MNRISDRSVVADENDNDPRAVFAEGFRSSSLNLTTVPCVSLAFLLLSMQDDATVGSQLHDRLHRQGKGGEGQGERRNKRKAKQRKCNM